MSQTKQYICDTNVIVRYLVADDDRLFKSAQEFFEEVIQGDKKVVIEQTVFIEVVFVLSSYYQVPRSKIADSLSALLQYKGVAVASGSKYLLDALKLYASTLLHIVDCILVTRAKSAELELFTFDQELKRKYEDYEKHN